MASTQLLIMHFIIETYTRPFDFPVPATPPASCTYMLATVPRTGSTYLCHRLWRTGCLGAPLEYLNPVFYEPAMQWESCADLETYWRQVRSRRSSPNGVFGWKMFTPSYVRIAEQTPVLLPRIAPDHVIYLTRRDKIEQAVSYAMAIDSGAWFSGADHTTQPSYSREVVERALRMIEQQEQSWQRIFERTTCSYLPVYYEDVIADWQGAVRSIADFCGVSLGAELDALPHVPLPDKQGDRTNHEWAEVYRRCVEAAGARRAEAAETPG